VETKTVILLAMHGMPPSDFSKDQLSEWGGLHSTLDRLSGEARSASEKRYLELDGNIRNWPRTPENDAYHAASYRLARRMQELTGFEVVVGFNEFAKPALDEAFEGAVRSGAGRVVVVTPMMTRGGSHSESDIPREIERAKAKHPGLSVAYVWPLDEDRISEFLSAQLEPYLRAEGPHSRPAPHAAAGA
jgi:sirohydrochlorin cobaltochelatase